jgi:predicted enzyme related to lactoylglutathione lyase
MANQVVWFDIPVHNLDRAVRFYSAILGTQVCKKEFPGATVGLLSAKEGEVNGCLVPVDADDENQPSHRGPLLYLNCAGRLDEAIAATLSNGGRILLDKHTIGAWGFRAIISDTEGNRLALHSP